MSEDTTCPFCESNTAVQMRDLAIEQKDNLIAFKDRQLVDFISRLKMLEEANAAANEALRKEAEFAKGLDGNRIAAEQEIERLEKRIKELEEALCKLTAIPGEQSSVYGTLNAMSAILAHEENKKLKELEEWKASMLAVALDHQAIGNALNLTLGTKVTTELVVEALKELEAQVETGHRMYRSVADAFNEKAAQNAAMDNRIHAMAALLDKIQHTHASEPPITRSLREEGAQCVYSVNCIACRWANCRWVACCNGRFRHRVDLVAMTLIKLPDGSWVRADSIRAIYRFDISSSKDPAKEKWATSIRFADGESVGFEGDMVDDIAAAVNMAINGQGFVTRTIAKGVGGR